MPRFLPTVFLTTVFLTLVVCLSPTFAADPIATNSDESNNVAAVKLLLSDRCFLCHGPDAGHRESGLRLDTVEGMTGPLESDEELAAVVAGDISASELISRILSDDPDTVMPPPDANLSLNKAEKELLKQWVKDGAPWEGHWSFQPIIKPSVPEVKNDDWCRNDIDRFIVRKQEQAKQPQNIMADKERLIRRVTFDLTGLPPTLPDIDAYLADNSASAFETVVDRLLASPAYGEHMTSEWLDVARYSDTYGYQVDRDRYVWPWRDWVIRSFNNNKPYDEFIIEQIAGDMLPDATNDQILATTFNRLHPQKVEGGSVEEEFRVEYVADRSQTVSTAFLGLTMECCRCHDHKYDPLSQKNYFQMFSFFNNVDEAGLYSYFTNSVPTPTLTLPTNDQLKKMAAAKQKQQQAYSNSAFIEPALGSFEIAPLDHQLVLTDDQKAKQKKWLQDHANHKKTIVKQWLQNHADDSIPLGQVAALNFDSGKFSKNEVVETERGKAVRLTGDHGIDTKVGNFARHQSFTISTWIKVPKAYERAVVFHRSKAWTDAASRGYELLIEDGKFSAALIHFWPGNAIRIRSLQDVPLDQWIHVTMAYNGSSVAKGLSLWLNGEKLETTVAKDSLTKNITGGGGDTITIGQRMRDKGFKGGLVDDFLVFDRILTPLEIFALAQNLDLKTELPKLMNGETPEWLSKCSHSVSDTYFSESKASSPWPPLPPTDQSSEKAQQTPDALWTTSIQRMVSPDFIAARKKIVEANQAVYDVQNGIQEIMVMRELPQPRPSWILVRGEYDAHGEPVTSDVPDFLPALPEGAPANRLSLAKWLTSEEQPLTARVTVNRFWQKLFGEGLVRTPEDFGNQGTLPTHPKLLDWLAADFREHKWDVKRLLKQMIMSSTYRQSSEADAQLTDVDPENLLLTRSSVYRLTAEMLRDNSLATSGLLKQQVGGAPVKPYELAASFKPSKPDTGGKLYRRSLYTYWQRTAPAPVMMTLDAAKRDVCRVKRERTASPLQALVVMNGPQFVEAARMLADRAIGEHADDEIAVLTEIYRSLTSLKPSTEAVEVLHQLYLQQKNHFATHPEAAKKYLNIGEAKPKSADTTVLAAWTSVANTVLALDDSMMRR
ncbi:MAG: DUF1553 domain-containing protein [Fuerstiella sp.]